MFTQSTLTQTHFYSGLWPACKLSEQDKQKHPFNSCCTGSHQHVLCLFYTFHMLLALVRLIFSPTCCLQEISKQPIWKQKSWFFYLLTLPAALPKSVSKYTHTDTPFLHMLSAQTKKYIIFDKQSQSIKTSTTPKHCTQEAAWASEPLKNPSLSEPTCKKTTIHNDYSVLSLIVYCTLFMRPIFLFILVGCHL